MSHQFNPYQSGNYTLAVEALTSEGPDAYAGATVDQLAEFLDANPDLWTPATDDSAWATRTGFGEALTAFVTSAKR